MLSFSLTIIKLVFSGINSRYQFVCRRDSQLLVGVHELSIGPLSAVLQSAGLIPSGARDLPSLVDGLLGSLANDPAWSTARIQIRRL